MKWIGDTIGIILVLIGIFWILQGTGVVPIGFMAHQIQWAIMGALLGIVGVGLVIYTHRRSGSNPRATG